MLHFSSGVHQTILKTRDVYFYLVNRWIPFAQTIHVELGDHLWCGAPHDDVVTLTANHLQHNVRIISQTLVYKLAKQGIIGILMT